MKRNFSLTVKRIWQPEFFSVLHFLPAAGESQNYVRNTILGLNVLMFLF